MNAPLEFNCLLKQCRIIYNHRESINLIVMHQQPMSRTKRLSYNVYNSFRNYVRKNFANVFIIVIALFIRLKFEHKLTKGDDVTIEALLTNRSPQKVSTVINFNFCHVHIVTFNGGTANSCSMVGTSQSFLYKYL